MLALRNSRTPSDVNASGCVCANLDLFLLLVQEVSKPSVLVSVISAIFKQPLVNKKRISFLLNCPGCFYKLVAEINVHQTMFFFTGYAEKHRSYFKGRNECVCCWHPRKVNLSREVSLIAQSFCECALNARHVCSGCTSSLANVVCWLTCQAIPIDK